MLGFVKERGGGLWFALTKSKGGANGGTGREMVRRVCMGEMEAGSANG